MNRKFKPFEKLVGIYWQQLSIRQGHAWSRLQLVQHKAHSEARIKR